jgi:plasmid stability protein
MISAGGNEVAQLVVRNLEDAVKAQLRARAARHGRSMEEEVREILRDATKEESNGGLGTRIVAMFSGSGLGVDLPEMPSWKMRVPSFVEDGDRDQDHDPA